MNNTEQEFNQYDGKYEILQNEAGNVLFIIGYRESDIDAPKVVYDGGSAILLYRSTESSVFLTNISKEANQAVMYANKVEIAEVKGDEVLREYYAPVHLIKDMREILN
ncbi:MAG: hypothetical protein E7004_00395 [Alphaproteobacteria bacterium]|nr:hypothetical protein [Alphaproteobacteria bacterium]